MLSFTEVALWPADAISYSRREAAIHWSAIDVRGTVQGVGFRPHVYSRHGFAQKRGAHLFIDLEGDSAGSPTCSSAQDMLVGDPLPRIC